MTWSHGGPAHASGLDLIWCLVVDTIPSRHMRGEIATRATAFRLHLAREAQQRRARGELVRYLEVGVRMGHSLAFVALAAGESLDGAVGIDPWIKGYGGEENAGAASVYTKLSLLGVDTDKVDLRTADSHEELPDLAHRATFNLMLIDGDHTPEGAARDLRDAWPMLEPGGVLVFDDTYAADDPRTPGPHLERGLLDVWRGWIEDLHGDGHMIDAHEVLDDLVPWCWMRRAL